MRANVEDRGMKGDCTPLMEAASAGHGEIVKLLLSHNADVNAQSSSGKHSIAIPWDCHYTLKYRFKGLKRLPDAKVTNSIANLYEWLLKHFDHKS